MHVPSYNTLDSDIGYQLESVTEWFLQLSNRANVPKLTAKNYKCSVDMRLRFSR